MSGFEQIYAICKPFTMTSRERMEALYESVNRILDLNIEGDFVECGLYRGGSSMLMALTALLKGNTSRKIWMYDTYEGMTEPGEEDIDFTGRPAQWTKQWCYCSLDEVVKNMNSTGYPVHQFQFIKGMVEDTIPGQMPEKISLLRLDTDWYSSTKHEMVHLYPLLQKGGVLIVDDYGHWRGSKKAVDETIENGFLKMIDYTGAIYYK